MINISEILEKEIIEFLERHRGQKFRAREIARGISRLPAIRPIIEKLARQGVIKRMTEKTRSLRVKNFGPGSGNSRMATQSRTYFWVE